MSRSDRDSSILEQLVAIIRYELLWNIRKKKVVAMFLVVLGVASLALFLPMIMGNSADNPNYFINNLLNAPNLVIVILAIAVSMNSISGEFENGTIEPLASKPISRARIYLGKVFAMLILLFGIYSVLELYGLGGCYLLYGSQNGLNLSLLVAPILLTVSTLVWVSVSLVFGSVTKSSVAAAIGTIGIFFAILFGGGIITTVAPESGGTLNYLPGDGESGNINGQFYPEISENGLSINTGTNYLARQFVLSSHNSSAVVRISEIQLDLENARQGGSPVREVGYHSYKMDEVAWRSLFVSLSYILVLGVIAWYSFERSDISV